MPINNIKQPFIIEIDDSLRYEYEEEWKETSHGKQKN